MSLDDSILREQMRQLERKQSKKKASEEKKKQKHFELISKKKIQVETDVITVDQFKKLNDDSAKRKAENNLRTWCHRYVKIRDLYFTPAGKIEGKCIYCDRIWKVEFYSDGLIINSTNWSACHFHRADLFESVEYDEDNIHLGCNTCNRYGGNLADYEKNLIEKIGQERFDQLTFRKNNPKSLNILEMIKLKEKFMDLTKDEIKRLGIRL